MRCTLAQVLSAGNNRSRTYHTTVPSRPEMINIIRTAFDRGVTFYDAAEEYGPHEIERILGEAPSNSGR
jgi:aryl-alcohol dehydrogenase-like predicted oxidoreductase